MHRFSLIILLFLFLCGPTFGQKLIKGKVLNRNTKEPIPYANIGIVNSNVGTLSNTDGSFSIVIPARLSTDTLIFLALGFGKKQIPVKFLEPDKEYTIFLNEKITFLNPVTVTAKKERNIIFELGNRDFSRGEYEPDTIYAGRAISLLVDNKEHHLQKGLTFPVFLVNANLRIFRNNLKSFKFRIRLNDVDSLTGQPGEDLLQESIVAESSIKKGWLTFDLSHLNYMVTKPFFVTFEQILDMEDRAIIADGYREFISQHPERLKSDTIEFNGKKEVIQRITTGGIDLPGTFIATSTSDRYSCFVRATSFGEWKKVPGIVAATVSVSKQPVNNITNAETKEGPCNNNLVECRVENLCKDFMDETGVNGMQLCVGAGNKIKWSTALGYADLENNIPVTDSTRFRINSVSKAMTSVALIKLLSENKLDLDVPIQKYIPGFPGKQYPITTRQLSGHLAGFRDYKENDLSDFIRTEHFDNATQALRIFENDTLLFKPGSEFYYSTFGWNLIGAVIEGITGLSYLDYMRKNIWEPMKLLNTCGDDKNSKIPNRSKFYDATGQENDLGDLSYKYPGGGLLSTASDLVKFSNELLHGMYINPALKKILFETQYTEDGQPTGYGIGWYTGIDKNGHRIWYHGGDTFSSSSYLIIYPDDDIVIAFLANSQDGAAFDIQKIGELFYKE